MRHAWHAPSHAESQHTPSTRNPDAQAAAVAAAAPLLALHSATSLQLFPSFAAHESASSRFSTSLHLPGVTPAHVAHVPHFATLQQTPSLQNPPLPTHASSVVHDAPSVMCIHVSP
jgi:hypothetical protein